MGWGLEINTGERDGEWGGRRGESGHQWEPGTVFALGILQDGPRRTAARDPIWCRRPSRGWAFETASARSISACWPRVFCTVRRASHPIRVQGHWQVARARRPGWPTALGHHRPLRPNCPRQAVATTNNGITRRALLSKSRINVQPPRLRSIVINPRETQRARKSLSVCPFCLRIQSRSDAQIQADHLASMLWCVRREWSTPCSGDSADPPPRAAS
jgi:hypothetical protein